MYRFKARPDWESKAALDELRTSRRAPRRTFSDYERVLDRIVDQIPRHALRELRSIIRTQGKVIDDWLWSLPSLQAKRVEAMGP
jgi:hypothetical protein